MPQHNCSYTERCIAFLPTFSTKVYEVRKRHKSRLRIMFSFAARYGHRQFPDWSSYGVNVSHKLNRFVNCYIAVF